MGIYEYQLIREDENLKGFKLIYGTFMRFKRMKTTERKSTRKQIKRWKIYIYSQFKVIVEKNEQKTGWRFCFY